MECIIVYWSFVSDYSSLSAPHWFFSLCYRHGCVTQSIVHSACELWFQASVAGSGRESWVVRGEPSLAATCLPGTLCCCQSSNEHGRSHVLGSLDCFFLISVFIWWTFLLTSRIIFIRWLLSFRELLGLVYSFEYLSIILTVTPNELNRLVTFHLLLTRQLESQDKWLVQVQMAVALCVCVCVCIYLYTYIVFFFFNLLTFIGKSAD